MLQPLVRLKLLVELRVIVPIAIANLQSRSGIDNATLRNDLEMSRD
jgi:hypothetical protein